MADPVGEEVLDEPFFALRPSAVSNGSSPAIEFESLPSWVHEPPRPVIADVDAYVEHVIQEPEMNAEPLPRPTLVAMPAARPVMDPPPVVPVVAAPALERRIAPPVSNVRESAAPFKAQEISLEPKSRTPLFVAGGVVVASLLLGGSYFGFKSLNTHRATPTAAPVTAPAVSAPVPAAEISTATPTSPKNIPSAEHKNVKPVKSGSAASTAKQQEQPDDEVAVTLSRDVASNALRKTDTAEAPTAPSLNSVNSATAANDPLSALAGAPTTRVATEARSATSEPATLGVTGGKLLRRVAPIYPDFARRSGITGTVVLAGTVTKEGMVKHIKVISGNSLLADSAVRAVNAWRYSPFMYNGKPVETETRIVLNFNH
jgi:TonB family protein